MDTTTTQTVKQAAPVSVRARQKPAVAAGVGTLAMAVATYLGARWGWEPEMVGIMAAAIGVVTTLAVHYLHSNFPVLLNALETATNRDLDRDGDIGQ